MRYPEAYAHIYQKMQGFKIKIFAPNNKFYKGYLSLNPSTRSTYDIAMREATIDGLITMDNIEKLKPSQLFFIEDKPNEIFILQSVNKFEMQYYTKNINAIKINSNIDVKRLGYNETTGNDEYQDVYKNVVSFVTTQNKDEKNFQAGIEDNTTIAIQIPKRNINNEIYLINNQDRIILRNLEEDLEREIKVESVDEFSVSGVIKIYGTFETRTGD